MDSHQLINQTSGNVEWYTPSWVVDAARYVMGSIDLDPASSEIANQTVRAERYYTISDDGLNKSWRGNVWLNHPYGRHGNREWIKKLCDSYKAKEIDQACCICFAATSEKWFQPLFEHTICFPFKRVNFLDPSGKTIKGVTKGCAITYLGGQIDRFAQVFSKYGNVVRGTRYES